jgi:hypothetical protein
VDDLARRRVDRRVVAIMPTVIDALNSEVITRHHFEALGFFSSALDDYVRHGLFPHKIGTPEYRAVLAIEDRTLSTRERLATIPKYLVNASGDQFFLPDNSQFISRTSSVKSICATSRTRGIILPEATRVTACWPSIRPSSPTGHGPSSRGRRSAMGRCASPCPTNRGP